MPTTPPIAPPASVGGAAATAAQSTPQTSAVPQVRMDPVTKQAILQQIQRAGWNAAEPQPDIQFSSNGLGGVVPVVKGYKMVITDPDTGTNETVDLTYDATQPGKGAQWGITDAPKSLPKPTTSPADYSSLIVKTTDQGTWFPTDPKNPASFGQPGGWKQILPPGVKNEDEEIKKAVDRQVAEGDRNAKQRNELATGLYVDDDTLARIRHLEATDKNAADTLKQTIASQTAKQKNDDAQQANLDKKYADDLLTSQVGRGLTTAQTAGQQATTAATLSSTDIAQKKLPGELKQQDATLESTLASGASTRQATQIAAQKTLEGGLANAYLTQRDPLTGAITQSGMNLAYEPKTQAQIAARVGQITSLMQQKGQEIQSRVDNKTITPEQGAAEWQNWYGTNVASQQQALQAAQDEAQFARGKELATMRTAAQTAADAVGAQAVNVAGAASARAYLDANQNPSYRAGGFTSTAAPDYDKIAREATAQALKYIDPTAAAQAGGPQPNLQAIDIAAALNSTNYMPGGMPPPPAAGPPGAAPPAAGPTNLAVAPIPGLAPGGLAQGGPRPAAPAAPAQFNSPFGAIGNDPMTAAMQRMMTPPVAAPEPVAAPPPPMPTRVPRPVAPTPPPVPIAAPGLGYDPSAMAGRQAAPGLGYDPTNIALTGGVAPGGGYDPTALWGALRGQGFDQGPIGPPVMRGLSPWDNAPAYQYQMTYG